MGRELLQFNEVFKFSIWSLNNYLRGIARLKLEYTIEEELKKPAKWRWLSSAELLQPLYTTNQITLGDTLKSLAIIPRAVVRQISNEVITTYVSAPFISKEGIIATYNRGTITVR